MQKKKLCLWEKLCVFGVSAENGNTFSKYWQLLLFMFKTVNRLNWIYINNNFKLLQTPERKKSLK